jgi:hypothetical protein
MVCNSSKGIIIYNPADESVNFPFRRLRLQYEVSDKMPASIVTAIILYGQVLVTKLMGWFPLAGYYALRQTQINIL